MIVQALGSSNVIPGSVIRFRNVLFNINNNSLN